ncbi:MAG: PAS domain-containing protein [Deltaproteobacteria bacterium]
MNRRGGACPAVDMPLVFAMLDSAPAGIIVLDDASHLMYMNRRAEEMIGVQARDLLGKPAAAFIDDADLVDLITRRDFDSLEPHLWSARSLLVTPSRLIDRNLPEGCFLLLQEMMPFQEMADRVNRLEGEFASVLESSYDGIVLADAETICMPGRGAGGDPAHPVS